MDSHEIASARIKPHEIAKCGCRLGHACGVTRAEPAAHHGPSPRISRGMRAGTAEDAGCVRGTSKAGCMRAACCPMPVQTGGQGYPNANRRLSKWVSKGRSKFWTGGGRRRRRSRGASPRLRAVHLVIAEKVRRDRGGIGCKSAAGSPAGRCGIDAGLTAIPRRSRTGITPSRLHANGALRS